ncbi:MAG: hypothetical protein KGL95_13875, partial [Patescibacteria group bacterium]|nr:hypothetical protein [Patescibacteria group bacterium]
HTNLGKSEKNELVAQSGLKKPNLPSSLTQPQRVVKVLLCDVNSSASPEPSETFFYVFRHMHYVIYL